MLELEPHTTDWIAAVGTALAAIGTVGAFIAALVQIKRERDARKRLEREVEQRQRRAQAEHISAWPSNEDPPRTEITVLNRSAEPVYRAVASLVMIQGAGPQTGKELDPLSEYRNTLALIPPGEYRTSVAGGWAGMARRPGVELAFTDRAGVHWVRCADGSLVEISQPPIEYYGLALPTNWSIPERIG